MLAIESADDVKEKSYDTLGSILKSKNINPLADSLFNEIFAFALTFMIGARSTPPLKQSIFFERIILDCIDPWQVPIKFEDEKTEMKSIRCLKVIDEATLWPDSIKITTQNYESMISDLKISKRKPQVQIKSLNAS